MAFALSPEQESLNGGRSLNAIWYSSLDCFEKLFMQYLGSYADFRGTFTEFSFHSLEKLQKVTSLSKSTILRIAKSLEKKGYIEREKRFFAGKGGYAPSNYCLTSKVFDEYIEYLRNVRKEHSVPQTPPRCPIDTMHSVPQTPDLPALDFPDQNTIVASADASTTPAVFEKVKKPKPDTELWKIWKAAYEEKKHSSPSTSAKRYKMCSDLTNKWGKEAQEVMRFYLNSRDDWHVKQEHSLECALSQYEKILDKYNLSKKPRLSKPIDSPVISPLKMPTNEERERIKAVIEANKRKNPPEST